MHNLCSVRPLQGHTYERFALHLRAEKKAEDERLRDEKGEHWARRPAFRDALASARGSPFEADSVAPSAPNALS
eukprot:7249865-Pyramimonas_sp.AAC.1